MVKETTTHVSMLYDGQAGIYYQAHSGKHALDMSWIPPASVQNCWTNEVKNPMKFQISHANSWGQVDTVLKNFTIKQLGTPDTGYIDGEIVVAPNATATLSVDASAASSPIAAAKVRRVSLAAGSELAVGTDVAGSRVEVESVVVSGAGARLSSTAKTTIGRNLIFTGDSPNTVAVFSGDVTFADGTATAAINIAKAPAPVPKTGETDSPFTFIGIVMLLAGVLGVIFEIRASRAPRRKVRQAPRAHGQRTREDE